MLRRGLHGAGAKGKSGTSTHGCSRRPRLPCRDLGGDLQAGRASQAEGLQPPSLRRTWTGGPPWGILHRCQGCWVPAIGLCLSPRNKQRKSHLSFKLEVEIPPEKDLRLHSDRVTCAESADLTPSEAWTQLCPEAQGGPHRTGKRGAWLEWRPHGLTQLSSLGTRSRAEPAAGGPCSLRGPL